jgi:ribosomal protein S18 acetylase RimI-like enzyme
MEIREARKEDNTALRETVSRIEIGNPDIRLRRVIRSDFFAKAKSHSQSKVLVAWEDGKIAGSAACSIRNGLVNGTPKRIGYLFQLFVAPECRRKGIARLLIRHLENELRSQDVDLCFLAVAAQNKPAMDLFQNGGYELYRVILNPGFAVSRGRKITGSAEIRSCTPEDLEPVSQLINQTWSGHDFFEPLTAESLSRSIDRMPGMERENLLILTDDGVIRACIGYWDSSDNTHLLVKSVSTKMKLMALLSRLMPFSGSLPRMPRPGETVKPALSLGFIGYRGIHYLSSLLIYTNNLALQKGISLVFYLCEEGNPLVGAAEGFYRITNRINFYTKALKSGIRLNGRPVFADAFEIF